MLALMGVIVLSLLVVGPAMLTGHPVLIVAGVAVGAAVLIATRRGLPTSRR
jgi:hypothetical protein